MLHNTWTYSNDQNVRDGSHNIVLTYLLHTYRIRIIYVVQSRVRVNEYNICVSLCNNYEHSNAHLLLARYINQMHIYEGGNGGYPLKSI